LNTNDRPAAVGSVPLRGYQDGMPDTGAAKRARPGAPVLVVEDDPDQRSAIVLALESEGYAVLTAASGVEALEVLDAGTKPCMILLDLMMPEMDGVQFRMEQLKRTRLASIPVVVASAFGQMTRAKYLQVADYLRKPLDLDQLLTVIERVTQRSA
jgi:CheY-like chemotaxis protein